MSQRRTKPCVSAPPQLLAVSQPHKNTPHSSFIIRHLSLRPRASLLTPHSPLPTVFKRKPTGFSQLPYSFSELPYFFSELPYNLKNMASERKNMATQKNYMATEKNRWAFFCISWALRGELQGLWLALSQHIGVVACTGLRSFHELHPVLGCGRLTACACGVLCRPFRAQCCGIRIPRGTLARLAPPPAILCRPFGARRVSDFRLMGFEEGGGGIKKEVATWECGGWL